jgi:ATP-dependent Clp protease adaptor protein ClpS
MSDKEKTREQPFIDESNEVRDKGENQLVLHNDEVNTFDFVIECLIEICKHTTEQAEQCTYLVHYKGKCEVKNGPFDVLRPMRSALIDKGLNATIE